MKLTITIPGRAQQKGSKRAFVNKYTGKAQLVDMNAKAAPYQHAISAAMRAAYHEAPVTGPVLVTVGFYFQRPKKHFRTGKLSAALRDDAPCWHAQAPDIDKLLRVVLDAGTGIIWRDDGQVQIRRAVKWWATRDETEIVIDGRPDQDRRMTDGPTA